MLDQKGECGVVAAATCDLLLVPRKAVLKWLDDLAVEARHAEDLDLQAAAARRLAALAPRGAADDDAATLGRRRAAEDDAWRRARG